MFLHMENNNIDRQNTLYEHLSTMQTLCIFILMLGFVIYKQVIIFYPPNGMHIFFVLLCLIGLGTVLFYNSTSFRNINILESQPLDDYNHRTLVKYIYITIPFLVALALIFISEKGFLVETVFILPVLFAATVLGAKASFLMSTVYTLILIFIPVRLKT